MNNISAKNLIFLRLRFYMVIQ